MGDQQASGVALRSLLDGEGSIHRLVPGECLLAAGEPPGHVWWVLEGNLRSLMDLPPGQSWRTVERHGEGCLVGWLGLIHGRPIEHLRAAEPTELLQLPAERFHALWQQTPALRQWCASQTPPTELVHLLQQLAHANPARGRQLDFWDNLRGSVHWCVDAAPTARSGGKWHWPDGTCWPEQPSVHGLQQRLLWIPDPAEQAIEVELDRLQGTPQNMGSLQGTAGPSSPLSLKRASGAEAIPLAICEALAEHLQVPFERDNLTDQIRALLQQQKQLNLLNIGQLLSSLDLSVSLCDIPLAQLPRVPTPAVIEHLGSIAILEGVPDHGELRLLELRLLTVARDGGRDNRRRQQCERLHAAR